MSEKKADQQRGQQQSKQDKLAAKLRENLQKRKAQVRGRKQASPDEQADRK